MDNSNVYPYDNVYYPYRSACTAWTGQEGGGSYTHRCWWVDYANHNHNNNNNHNNSQTNDSQTNDSQTNNNIIIINGNSSTDDRNACDK